MLEIKENIIRNLEFLNEQQLRELATFTAFLKVRSKIQSKDLGDLTNFSKYINEDLDLAEAGIDDYNQSLLKEDTL
jgi:hypothetical protein